MRSADWTRLSAQLPAAYQDDAESFAQVDAFLGLVDELGRAVVERLDDLASALGPDAVLRWPTDLPFEAGADALLGTYLAVFDEVAGWADFTFPPSWPRDEPGLLTRREYLARSARIWRRRGTPRGFLSWFCLWFAVPGNARPVLVEHFVAPGAELTGEPWTATLFVPATPAFSAWDRRAEAEDFVRRYAPAHVHVRVCFVLPTVFDDLAVLTSPPVLPPSPTQAQVGAFAAAVATRQKDLNALLCSVVSVVTHENGVHLHACVDDDEGRPGDRLDVGRLPTDPPPA
jgi:hypothetical protein